MWRKDRGQQHEGEDNVNIDLWRKKIKCIKEEREEHGQIKAQWKSENA